jgi:hypothetical protein
MPTRSSTATEPVLRSSQVALTRCLPRSIAGSAAAGGPPRSRNRNPGAEGKGEADLGLARILGLDMGPTVTDQPIRVAQGHGELEPFAGRIGMDSLQFVQELSSLARTGGRLPALVAGGLGIGPVGDEGVQVLGRNRRNASRSVLSAVKAASPIVCLRCRQRHLGVL